MGGEPAANQSGKLAEGGTWHTLIYGTDFLKQTAITELTRVLFLTPQAQEDLRKF